MYDLEDDIAERFRTFSEQFEMTGRAAQIWNIDTTANTSDWKRNAGAGRLLTRKPASFFDAAPSVVKTNISVPCIRGGKQSLHFFPDIVLIVEGSKAGALSYEQLDILWNTTIFIETDGVPSDSHIVGYTWRFVNKKGGPDRRFNNNRQIPEVEYQQMGIRGGGGLQKILHLSRVADRSGFDAALRGLRGLIKEIGSNSKNTSPQTPLLLTYEGESNAKDRSPLILAGLLAGAGVIAVLLYFLVPVSGSATLPPQQPAAPINTAPVTPLPAPMKPVLNRLDQALKTQAYLGPGNGGSDETDDARVVTEFYRSLKRGDGEAAAAFVVPEKSQHGSLSGAALTAKFSRLQEPLHLDNVDRRANGVVRARYSYMPASGLKCVGLATVVLDKTQSEPLIKRIAAKELCR